MAKVSVHLGFTFRVGPLETNQYSRIDVDVRDIDTELSVTDQLTETTDQFTIITDIILFYQKFFLTLIREPYK